MNKQTQRVTDIDIAGRCGAVHEGLQNKSIIYFVGERIYTRTLQISETLLRRRSMNRLSAGWGKQPNTRPISVR